VIEIEKENKNKKIRREKNEGRKREKNREI